MPSEYLPDSFVKFHLAEAYEKVLGSTDGSDAQIKDSKEQWNRRVEILGGSHGFSTLSTMLDRIEEQSDGASAPASDESPIFPDEHPFETNSALWGNRRILTDQIACLYLLFCDSWRWEEIKDAHETVNETPIASV